MSFDYDPFQHFEIIRVDYEPEPETNPGETIPSYAWLCHSCGGDSSRKGIAFGPDMAVIRIEESYQRHLRDSHKLTPEDTKSWSKF